MVSIVWLPSQNIMKLPLIGLRKNACLLMSCPSRDRSSAGRVYLLASSFSQKSHSSVIAPKIELRFPLINLEHIFYFSLRGKTASGLVTSLDIKYVGSWIVETF